MNLLLYINGQLADLDAGQTIAQTKQVNDLNSLDNRQASYTNKFKLPKTATNTKIMQFLTVAGNQSPLPYQKNECSLYSSNGECFVYKGWAVITDGGTDYEAVIYDGIIDLYKAIENKTLADLDNLENTLNHTKTLANVTNSWTDPNCRYKYILADYNGSTVAPALNFDTNPVSLIKCIDMDYLIPSVKVHYLWEAIFAKYGFTWSGSVFETEDFKNLYITFPAGVTSNDLNTTLLESTDYTFNAYGQYYGYNSYYAKFNSTTNNALQSSFLGTFLQVAQTGTYRIEVSGSIKKQGVPTKIFIAKNAMLTPINSVAEFASIKNNLESEEEFNRSSTFNLEANDSIAIVVKPQYTPWFDNYSIDLENATLSVKLVKVDGQDVDFKKAFANFSIRDFVNEVVHRFGLTLFKDAYKNGYTFLTLQEQLQTPDIVNWSQKFVKKISEKYEFSNYAQSNYLRYAYNNKEDTYYDGIINVANVNLPESKDMLKSKIYAPDEKRGTIANKTANVYRLWEKELVEETDDEGNTTVKTAYKSLDNRYYFLKYNMAPISPAQYIYSTTYNQKQLINSAPFESFWKLPFSDIKQDYYSPLQTITDNARIITADLWLTDTDIANFDFKKLYYVEQLSSYFIMNKINNYISGKVTRCEMVRVQYTTAGQPYLLLTHIEIDGLNTTNYYSGSFANSPVTLQYHQGNGVWLNAGGGTQSPIPLTYPFAGTFIVRLWCNGVASNTITITLPSNQTVYL